VRLERIDRDRQLSGDRGTGISDCAAGARPRARPRSGPTSPVLPVADLAGFGDPELNPEGLEQMLTEDNPPLYELHEARRESPREGFPKAGGRRLNWTD
jgi:hypothetical protein